MTANFLNLKLLQRLDRGDSCNLAVPNTEHYRSKLAYRSRKISLHLHKNTVFYFCLLKSKGSCVKIKTRMSEIC